MARPSSYTDAIATEICERIAGGDKIKVIALDEGMPCEKTIYNWIKDHAAFAEKISNARRAWCEATVEEVLEIVDDGRNDWMERETRNGTIMVVNQENVQRSRLRAETRLKLLAVFDPNRFGAKPVPKSTTPAEELTDEALTKRIADIEAKLNGPGAAVRPE